ncbi:MAG: acyl-CoA carboxylase subunit epsilon [Mycobacteriaceae bacterium]
MNLRIERGTPTDTELGALVVVLAAVGGREPEQPLGRERWGNPAELLRVPLHPGPGAWGATLHQL